MASSCPLSVQNFLVAGRRIALSNKNRLASKIEAVRCNQRSNINPSVIEVRRVRNDPRSLGCRRHLEEFEGEVSSCDMGVDETARQTTLYLPGFSSGRETVSNAPFD